MSLNWHNVRLYNQLVVGLAALPLRGRSFCREWR